MRSVVVEVVIVLVHCALTPRFQGVGAVNSFAGSEPTEPMFGTETVIFAYMFCCTRVLRMASPPPVFAVPSVLSNTATLLCCCRV